MGNKQINLANQERNGAVQQRTLINHVFVVNGLKAVKTGKWFKTQNNFFYCAVFVLLLSMPGCCGSLRPFSLHSSTLIQSLLYFLLLSELTNSNTMISLFYICPSNFLCFYQHFNTFHVHYCFLNLSKASEC